MADDVVDGGGCTTRGAQWVGLRQQVVDDHRDNIHELGELQQLRPREQHSFC
jgi:hypothetical protein